MEASVKVSVEAKGPCRKVLHIEVPVEEVSNEYGKVLKTFARSATLRGFRTGRAPVERVERQYAKSIREETRDRIVPRSYHAALEQEKISPVSVVRVGDAELVKDLPLRFDVTVDVRPDFALPAYRGLPLKAQKVEVTDGQIDEAISHLLENRARFEPVVGRPARAGDLAQVDYEGTCEGQSVEDLAGAEHAGLGKRAGFWLLLGEQELLPGLSKGLEGATVGERREVAIEFPADFRVPALAGRRAAYAVEVKALREKHLPELDEALLKEFDAESVEHFKARVGERLTAMAGEEERRRLRQEAIRWLLDRTEMPELPQSMVEEEARHIVQNVVMENVRRGVAREQIESRREDIFGFASQSSAERVKLMFILRRIADQEGIGVDDGELDGAVAGMAAQRGVAPERLKADLDRDGLRGGLQDEICGEKALALVLREAKMEEG